jgi:hypothetical protein
MKNPKHGERLDHHFGLLKDELDGLAFLQNP